MSSTTVTTYTCDRPGCGKKIESSYRAGNINFVAINGGDSWATTSGNSKDICERCQQELVEYWFKLTE